MFENQIYVSLFSELMPSWATRGGYIDTHSKTKVFPDFIVSIPIQFAPPSSLDLLFIEEENAPSSPRVLSGYLQTLAPGGVAVIHLRKEYWNKKLILQTIEISGFSIIFIDILSNEDIIFIDDFKIKVIKKNYKLYLKKNWLLIIKKRLYKPESELNYQFSFFLKLSLEKQHAFQKIRLWSQFLEEHKIYRSEILLYDFFKDIIENSESGLYNFFKQTEKKNSNFFLDGIFFSRGKNLFLDMDSSLGNPLVFFEILDFFVKKNESTKPISIYAKDNSSSFFRYRLYNTKCLELFIRYYTEIQFSVKNFSIEKQIRKEGRIFELKL